MNENRTIAIGLVAHDEKKAQMVEWTGENRAKLTNYTIYATGTTGSLIKSHCPDLDVRCLMSGPLGGDQQLGAMICEDRLNMLVFFIDPLSPHPHDVDVKALIRLATVYDLPHACNKSTADIIVNSL